MKTGSIRLFNFCLLLTLFGCYGDLPYNVHVVKNYYLVGHEKSDLDLGYHTGYGNYDVVAPENIIEYGYNEHFLIAKTKSSTYFTFDLTQDYHYAKLNTIRKGPITQNEFDSAFKKGLGIKMKKVSDLK